MRHDDVMPIGYPIHYRKKPSIIDNLYFNNYLDSANQQAAEKFAYLCEKMSGNYQKSYWRDYVENSKLPTKYLETGNNLQNELEQIFAILGDDLQLMTDIIIKNHPLEAVEVKYDLQKGDAKRVLRDALDKLADLFSENIADYHVT